MTDKTHPDTRQRQRPTAVALALALALPPLLASGHLVGCTVDEDTVEGRECVPGSTDPQEQCVSGYKCVSYPDGARCEVDKKTGALRVGDHGPAAPRPSSALASDRAPLAPDYAHNLRLLRRLGLAP